MGSERENILQIAEIMSREPVSCSLDVTVQHVADLMKQFTISSVVVLENDLVVGIITVDDIVRKAVALGKDTKKTLAKEIMSTDIISIKPDAYMRDAMILFGEEEIRQVPVMQDAKLVGFLTEKDVLRIEPTLADLALAKMREKEDLRQIRIQKFVNKEFIDDEDEEDLM